MGRVADHQISVPASSTHSLFVVVLLCGGFHEGFVTALASVD